MDVKTTSIPQELLSPTKEPYVVEFVKPGCQPCKQNLRMLRKKVEPVVPVTTIDVTEHPWALEFLTNTLNVSATPITAVVHFDYTRLLTADKALHGDTLSWWHGFSPDTIETLEKILPNHVSQN